MHFPHFSPDGYMYEKEAILEYILHQKTEIAKKMKVCKNTVFCSVFIVALYVFAYYI